MRGEMSDEAKDIVKSDILAQEVGYTTRKQSKLLEIADRNVADNPKVSMDLMDGFRKTGGAGARDSDIAEGVALMKYARSVAQLQLRRRIKVLNDEVLKEAIPVRGYGIKMFREHGYTSLVEHIAIERVDAQRNMERITSNIFYVF